MGRHKQPIGTQRTFSVMVRFKPQVKDQVQAKLAWLRTKNGHEKATMSDLVRLATWEYCKEIDDPRQA